MPRESTVHRGARRVHLLRGKVQTSLRLGSACSLCTVLALLGLPLPSPGEHAFPTQTCSPLTPELQQHLFQCSLEKWTAPGTSDPLLLVWGFFCLKHYKFVSHGTLYAAEQGEALFSNQLEPKSFAAVSVFIMSGTSRELVSELFKRLFTAQLFVQTIFFL